MAYNPNDFVIIPKPLDRWNKRQAIVVAHNKSSIPINSVEVSYRNIGKDGVTKKKSDRITRNIAPGEKAEILNVPMTTEMVGLASLQVTDITVNASDGTVFKTPLPATFRAPSCFVTTAAYGDAGHPMVESFRCLRDEVLINHKAGRSFIDWYNRKGPELAAMIEHRPLLRAVTRMLLTPLAKVVLAFRRRLRS